MYSTLSRGVQKRHVNTGSQFVLGVIVVLPLRVGLCCETEAEAGLRDDAGLGQPGAVWSPPPPTHGEEGQLHTED